METNSLSGDVLVAYGNTSLNTQRLEPGTLPWGMPRGKRKREEMNQFRMLRMRSVKRTSEIIESSSKEPKLPGEAANSRHQTTFG